MPRVSIIITTHNRVKLLRRAIESALNAGTNVEVIVVDDASSDETEDFCRNLDGIKYVRLDRNQKTAGARNVGIVASESPFIAFLDDDDWRLPGSIDAQVDLLELDPECGLVYGRFLQATQMEEILPNEPIPENCAEGDLFWQLLESNIFGCLTAVFRRECIERVGLLDTSPDMVGIEDYDLWIRIAEFFPIRAVNKAVAVYRVPTADSDQWSSDVLPQTIRRYKACKTKWLKMPRIASELGKDADRKRRDILNSLSERILFDMAHNTVGIREKIGKVLAAVRCYPPKMYSLTFYKTLLRNFIF